MRYINEAQIQAQLSEHGAAVVEAADWTESEKLEVVSYLQQSHDEVHIDRDGDVVILDNL